MLLPSVVVVVDLQVVLLMAVAVAAVLPSLHMLAASRARSCRTRSNCACPHIPVLLMIAPWRHARPTYVHTRSMQWTPACTYLAAPAPS
jgi:hypothetical protein